MTSVASERVTTVPHEVELKYRVGDLAAAERLLAAERLGPFTGGAGRARATQLLDDFDLSEAAGKLARTYSGGMRRRLDLAASLVGRPPFLYLDEPTTGLDPASRRDLWTMIRRLVSDGTTVLLTTQYLDEADQLAVSNGISRKLALTQVISYHLAVDGINYFECQSDEGVEEEVEAFARDEDAIHIDGEAVTVSIADRVSLGEVARRLDDEGIVMDELALRRPSLDEVFLAITGHVTEADELGIDADAERRSS